MSLLSAKAWIEEIVSHVGDIIIAIVGNKADLEINRDVEYADIKSFNEDENIIFFETSAKNSTNVDELFFALCK